MKERRQENKYDKVEDVTERTDCQNGCSLQSFVRGNPNRILR